MGALFRLWGPGLAVGMAVASACGTDEPPSPVEEWVGVEVQPAPAGLRRLLARQYVASVEVLLGETAAAAADPPSDSELNGFSSIAASQLGMTDELVQRYESSARKIARAAMQDPERIAELLACDPADTPDAVCLERFVRRFGRVAWRRPLEEDEVDDYVALAKLAAEQRGELAGGLELVIAAMLQSPHFLYQVELGAPVEGRRDLLELTGYEVAARLSFLLHDRTPSEALLDAAEAGELDSAAGVRRWARELLHDDRAREASRSFFAELLVLEELETLAKDPTLFPEYSPQLAHSMREETLRFVDYVLWEHDEPFGVLLSAPYSFVDGRLASVYGIGDPGGWAKVTLPSEQGRLGLLTHASIMSRQAHATSTSATFRGLFVMERFLCRTMPPPPEGVVTELPPSSAAPTLRERIAMHQSDQTCRTCHYTADNLGLTFERFDAIGRYRSTENGATIDASGAVEGIGGWDDAAGLAEVLASSPEVKHCLVRQLYRHATGHVELKREMPAIDELTRRWAKAGHRYSELLLELAASDLFRHIGAAP